MSDSTWEPPKTAKVLHVHEDGVTLELRRPRRPSNNEILAICMFSSGAAGIGMVVVEAMTSLDLARDIGVFGGLIVGLGVPLITLGVLLQRRKKPVYTQWEVGSHGIKFPGGAALPLASMQSLVCDETADDVTLKIHTTNGGTKRLSLHVSEYDQVDWIRRTLSGLLTEE
jgi:hypothetical protein